MFYFCENNGLLMNERLIKFLSAENITQSQLADTLGVARASISHILSGRNKPGFDFLESLARNYPALSLEWLITGRGKMYRTPPGEPSDDPLMDLFHPSGPSKVGIERIVVFFEDGTFKEFR